MTGLLLVAPPVLFVMVFFLAPLALMVFMSFNNWPLLGQHRWIGLDNYAKIVGDATFRSALLFTLKYTLVLTPVVFFVGLGLAFLVKNPRRGVGFFRTVYFVPVVLGFASAAYLAVFLFNPQVGTIGKVLTDLHITRSPPEWLSAPGIALVAVALMVTWKTVGFTMLLLMTGLQSIPQDITEAAQVDGSGRFNTLLHITLPLLAQDHRAVANLVGRRIDAGLRPVLHHDRRRTTKSDDHRRLQDLQHIVRLVRPRLRLSHVGRPHGHLDDHQRNPAVPATRGHRAMTFLES